MEKNGKKNTQQNSILLHLDMFNRFRDSMEVPLDITQEGIAKKLGVTQSKASSLADKLIKNGQITDDLRHIAGKKRRRKTYFLTETGIQEVESLKSDKEQRYVDYADKAPEIKYFFGRTKEIEEFEEWLESDHCKVFVITGIAGIGKTTYITKVTEPYMESRHVFKHRFTQWSTLRDLLTRTGDFLSDMKKPGLSNNLQAKETVDFNEIAIILKEDLESLNALLIFDDYHNVKNNEEIVQWFGVLKDILESIAGTKIIIIGREVPRFFYDMREVEMKNLVKELKLDGLDIESSLELLKVRDISGRLAERLYTLTRGHPLWLELIHKTGWDFETQQGIKRFISDEIFSHLTAQERTILEIASVFRYPTHPSAYLDIAGLSSMEDTEEGVSVGLLGLGSESPDLTFEDDQIGYDIIDSLINKSLISQTSDGICDVQNMIREFAYKRISNKQIIEYHDKIAKYYMERTIKNPQTLLEAHHHLIMAGNLEEAAKQIIEDSKRLLQEGFWRELFENVERIPIKSIHENYQPDMIFIRGKLYDSQGDLNKALEDMDTSIEYFNKINGKMGMARAYEWKGMIMRKKSLWKDSLKNFQNALKIYKDLNDIGGMGDICNQIGTILNFMGEYKSSVEAFAKALEYTKKAENKGGIAMTHANMAILMHNIRQYDDAIKYSKKALAVFIETNNKSQITRMHVNIGAHLVEKGEYKEANKWLNKSIKLAKETSDMWNIVYSLSNLAESYALGGDANDLDMALECCKRAEKIATMLYDLRGIVFINRLFGVIFGKKGDLELSEKHFKKALDISLKRRMPEDTAQVYLHYGRILVEFDKTEKAKDQFEAMKKLCDEVGNHKMADIAKEEIKKLSK